ncbi:hypothetical protein DPMN_180006 [Dreissena polymorpha]|uniref:Uncharacterized protein n=1 Tax=Dreissena polymorpha TaxID=45954 RepID=A0A9D4EHA0_DREPO|nr:hypothetical protein DPMN_180006 [Dreissena polymorpha]
MLIATTCVSFKVLVLIVKEEIVARTEGWTDGRDNYIIPSLQFGAGGALSQQRWNLQATDVEPRVNRGGTLSQQGWGLESTGVEPSQQGWNIESTELVPTGNKG